MLQRRKRARINARACVSKRYRRRRVRRVKNYSLTCRRDGVSATKDTRESPTAATITTTARKLGARGGEERERERRSGVRMLSRRLIYGRNDRTDSRKLRVVSHNLGIRSPPTSTGNRAGRTAAAVHSDTAPRYVRMPIIYKAACVRRRVARKLHPHTSAPESNFARSLARSLEGYARCPAACRYLDNARVCDRLTARTEACCLPPSCSYYLLSRVARRKSIY